jgi:hypothetical protein
MFMGAEAAVLVFMVVVMDLGGLSDGQRQQGERQGEKQAAHGKTPGEDEINVM